MVVVLLDDDDDACMKADGRLTHSLTHSPAHSLRQFLYLEEEKRALMCALLLLLLLSQSGWNKEGAIVGGVGRK